MSTAVWDQLRVRALTALALEVDRDEAARDLLAASGGDRRALLAAHMRIAADTIETPDDAVGQQILELLQRAIVLGDTEELWHPVYAGIDPWHFARHHT